jgi:hypothetical protein
MVYITVVRYPHGSWVIHTETQRPGERALPFVF